MINTIATTLKTEYYKCTRVTLATAEAIKLKENRFFKTEQDGKWEERSGR